MQTASRRTGRRETPHTGTAATKEHTVTGYFGGESSLIADVRYILVKGHSWTYTIRYMVNTCNILVHRNKQ